jgi:hypothetical protein
MSHIDDGREKAPLEDSPWETGKRRGVIPQPEAEKPKCEHPRLTFRESGYVECHKCKEGWSRETVVNALLASSPARELVEKIIYHAGAAYNYWAGGDEALPQRMAELKSALEAYRGSQSEGKDA